MNYKEYRETIKWYISLKPVDVSKVMETLEYMIIDRFNEKKATWYAAADIVREWRHIIGEK